MNKSQSDRIYVVLKVAVFLLCLGMSYGGIHSVIGHSNADGVWIPAFRAKDALEVKENSIDVLTIGASPNICGFSPMELYSEYGISAFSAGVSLGAGFDSNYILLDKILQEQTPEVVLIEVRSFFSGFSNLAFRITSDAVGITESKIHTIQELPEEYLADSRMSYIFPLLKYHTRYKNITKNDFFYAAKDDYYDYFQGFRALHGVMSVGEAAYPMLENENIIQGDSKQIYYLQKMIDLCKEKGINVILYKAPWNTKEGWNEAHYNAVAAYAVENGIPYLDLNLPHIAEEMNYDVYQDFNDSVHINFDGAVKVSRYLGKYLSENYDLPDRRGDSEYSYLDEELIRYECEKHNERFLHAANLMEYLDILCDESQRDYTMIISVKDEAFQNLGDELRNKLSEMGFQSDLSAESAYRHSFIGVWDNGKVVYEKLSEGIENAGQDLLEYRGTLSDGMKYYVKSAGYLVGNISSIVINGKEKSRNSRGLNIVIYDNTNSRVVDSISFDTFLEPGTAYVR